MIGRWAVLAALMAGACAPVPVSPDDWIEVATGGAFSGSVSTRIYATDRVVTTASSPGRSAPDPQESQAAPGAYYRARTLVEARLPDVGRASTDEICMDYGSDSVRVSRAVRGIVEVSVNCPDDGVTALMADVLGALQPAP